MKRLITILLIVFSLCSCNGQVPSIGGMQIFGISGSSEPSLVSCNWDATNIAYTSKYADVSAQCALPIGVKFNLEGTIMFVVEFSGKIYQYTLATAWDVSTASYANKSYTVAEDTQLYDVDFNNEGTIMYISGYDNYKIYQYTLATAWDVSTAFYANKSFYALQITTFDISSDGLYLIRATTQSRLHTHILSTAWDISTAGNSINDKIYSVSGVAISNDGSYLNYVHGGYFYQHYLSVPYYVSFNTLVKSINMGAQDATHYGICFPNTCGYIYVAGIGNDRIYQYSY